MRNAINQEIRRLRKLQTAASIAEALRHEQDFATGRVPSREVADRLVRYEAHLSREFDRTLSQLEGLQRMRKGQPVPPLLKVQFSS